MSMNMNNMDWKLERRWLKEVLEEIHKQLSEKTNTTEKFKMDAVQTQRELWQEIGSVSIANELEQLVDFMGFVDVMKGQKRSHDFTVRQQKKLEKMLVSPYFGRIDFLETGETITEKHYIGIANLMDEHFKFYVYDWRAPVSSMFYDHELGEADYVCPEGTIKGNLLLKRQYRIKDDEIEYMFDSNLKIDDEILQDILGKSTDGKMKTIVTTIQKEQNKVIRNEEYKNIIVQGPAGSGKTSVALHRIAYLLYKHRERINAKNIIIFSPNEIFNDYISNVLPELGEENMCQTTFQEYMHKSLNYGLKLENYSDMMEYILTCREKPAYEMRIGSIKYKSSLEFMELLKKYIIYEEKRDRGFQDIIYHNEVIISKNELDELFTVDYAKLPLKKRLHKMKERILFLLKPYEQNFVEKKLNELWSTGAYVSRTEVAELGLSAVREDMKDIYLHIDRITGFDIVNVYKQMFFNGGFLSKHIQGVGTEQKIHEIGRYTLENLDAGLLYYEDQPPLLYLKGMLGDLPKTSELKYVIIDEAQDYTPLQYEILHQLFKHANITLLGDLNQSINPFMNLGGYHQIEAIFPKHNTCRIDLQKSYRSTVEITEFARRLLGKNNTDDCVGRNGNRPVMIGFQQEEEIKDKILEDIRKFKEMGYHSIGIITQTKKEAEQAYAYLKEKTAVKAILENNDEYRNDTVVIPAYFAKGLEFDVVIIYNAGNGNYCREDERLLLYTACTRALHELCVYYTGERATLLDSVVS